MKRRLPLALFLVALMAALPSRAATCALDEAPGATLLLPYFEVDTTQPYGLTTLFSISNSSPIWTLAHVVLWTDAAVPTLSFDVYLTGYDVQTINLRDVFSGALPATADAGRDPVDTISPKGAFSQDPIVASCAGSLPPAPLPPSAQDALRRAHTGLGAAGDPTKCSGLAYGDGIARGYVTVDAARRCSILVPGDAGYFGADGVASDANVLWGDFFYVTPGNQATAQGQNLIRLESDRQGFVGRGTFYGHYVSAAGDDGREPLPSVWAVRYLNGGPFSGTTDLITWRDIRQRGTTFACGQLPAWYPLGQRQTIVFDEEENAYDAAVCTLPILCPPLHYPPSFPAAASRTRIGGSALPVPFDFGWLSIDLRLDTPIPNPSPAWIGTISSAHGLFSVGLAGTPLDEPCAISVGVIDPP